ncbi:MAG: acyl-CoA dehydrogenase [Bacteroidota bacterium]
MSAKPPILPFYSPGVQSLIPMFYVAWSDRVLSPSEIELLREKVATLDFLDQREKNVLKQWMNPIHPPSRELYKHWEIELQKAAEQLPKDSRKSLVDLGLSMAKQSAVQILEPETTIRWSSEATKNALEELETSLKVVNVGTYKRIFEKEEIEELAPDKAQAFDVEKMTSLLHGEYAELIERAKTLFKDPLFKREILPVKEDYRAKVLEWTKMLGEQGLGSLNYPKEYGGRDSMGEYSALFETLGYFDLSLAIKFGVQVGLFGGSVLWLGTKKHHDKYLEATGKIELLGCFAMTETGHGSNVRQLETTATYVPETDSFIVHSPRHQSGKEYIGNALHSTMASVFCQLIVNGENHGIHAVLVPLRDENGSLLEGIKVEDNGYKMGLNGVDNGRIWFNQVEVPRENLLNRFGEVNEEGVYVSSIKNPSRRFFTMLGTLVGGRVCVPRCGLSAAKSGIAIATHFGLKRRQFGPSFSEPETLILDYPSHQRRLMPLIAKAYALHFGLQYLTDRFMARSEDDIREIETLAAGMKSYATWFTTHALQECREACGGKGYLAENRFAHLKGGTEIFTTFEGDNTVLMQLVAKGVLTKFRQEFNEDGVIGVLRYIGGRVAVSFTEKNPITVRRTSKEHLLDSQMHLQAFTYREARLIYSISQRMRGWIKSGKSAYEAAIICQTHMLQLAEAFIERITLEQFCAVIEKQNDPKIKAQLQDLCNLYALHTIEEHKGWYLEQGYMEAVKTKAIRKMVDELCGKIRENARSLVDAWDISDELLGAEIL